MNLRQIRIEIRRPHIQRLGLGNMLQPQRFGFIEKPNQIRVRRLRSRIQKRHRHRRNCNDTTRIRVCPEIGCPSSTERIALSLMNLSISTLVCPTWSWPQIVGAAAAHGIGGIDLRGMGHEIDVSKLAIFDAELDGSLELLHRHGLEMPCLNTSIALVTPAAERWEMMLNECHRYARLAERSGAKYLRVFGGSVP